MARLLALDVGSRRVGLAITDDSKLISQPMPYTVDPSELSRTIKELTNDYEIEKIVVGLPKTMAGKESKQTEAVRNLINHLDLSVPFEFFDERLTARQAEGLARLGSTLPIDSLAAQQLLEQYLKLQSGK